jgi:hypothetical protein
MEDATRGSQGKEMMEWIKRGTPTPELGLEYGARTGGWMKTEVEAMFTASGEKVRELPGCHTKPIEEGGKT